MSTPTCDTCRSLARANHGPWTNSSAGASFFARAPRAPGRRGGRGIRSCGRRRGDPEADGGGRRRGGRCRCLTAALPTAGGPLAHPADHAPATKGSTAAPLACHGGEEKGAAMPGRAPPSALQVATCYYPRARRVMARCSSGNDHGPLYPKRQSSGETGKQAADGRFGAAPTL
jgi:hypothetical protein